MQVRETPPFAPVLMESTRAIGYSLEAAIADIIDNSIAAKAGKVQLSFFPVGDAYVSILDNGTGMDDAQMNIAMQYGSKSPTETRDSSDLGRYGLGLKTASLSQCRVLTVISKQGDQVIGRRWDLDYVIKTGAWSLLILDKEDFASVPHISDLYEQDSGTLVVWQNLDRLLMGEVDYEKSLGRKMDEVRQHLELVFHRYLSGESGIKKLEILFNGVKLKAADPFLIKKSTQAMDTETLVIRGKRILVTPYILPHISKMTEEEKNQLGGKDGIRKRQGFYVYRNKRLLIWGTWFRMMRQGDLSKLARVMVDIPNDLDDLWTLDIKKSHAIPPAEVRNSLQTVIDRIADKKTGEIALFQLKWQDPADYSPFTLKSKRSNYYSAAEKWLEIIEKWLSNSADEDIASKLGVKVKYFDKKKISIFVLGRRRGNYSGNGPYPYECAWSQWYQIMYAASYLRQENEFTISNLYKLIVSTSPFNIKISEKPVTFCYGKYRIKFGGKTFCGKDTR